MGLRCPSSSLNPVIAETLIGDEVLMATTKKPTAADFDNWTDQDDDAVIAKIVSETKIQHVVRGGVYYGRFPDGTVVDLPLKLRLAQLSELQSLDGDDPVEQITLLLKGLGNDAAVEEIQKQSIPLIAVFANDFFDLLNRATLASVGELAG